MFFLCTPFTPADCAVGYVIFFFLLLIYPLWYYSFKSKSLRLLERGEIRERIYKNLLSEKIWFLGLLGIVFLSAPTCMPFAFFLFGFPVYFAFSFIFFLFNKEKYNKEERKLLLLFYGIPLLVVLLMGIVFKIEVYKQYYGSNFLIGIFEYYVLGEGRNWFIQIFGTLIIVFVVLYVAKYFENRGRSREVS
jgi:membrane-associated HD superfamily phosphohydrolase